METRKPPECPAGEWLLRLLRQLADQAAGDLRRMRQHPETAVHAFRVRMKKLRALLALARSASTKPMVRSLTGRCRDLKDGFASARDEMVLRKLVRQWDLPLPVIVSTTGRPPRPSAHDTRAVQTLCKCLGALPLDHLTWPEILERHTRCRLAARKAMLACERDASPALFHTWRKAVKRFYFQSLALSRLRGARKRIRRAAVLGKRLGREHDLAVFISWLRGRRDFRGFRTRMEARRLGLHPAILRRGRKLLGDRLLPLAFRTPISRLLAERRSPIIPPEKSNPP